MKKVSIIIPTYNCESYIKSAVESAINQSYPNIEIIVIDDGSTDNTKSMLNDYHDKITYIFQKNKGISCARNTGINYSAGEYIALLDSDDVWMPNRLQKQIHFFEKDENIGLIHSDVIMIDEQDKQIGVYKRNKNKLSGFISKNLLLREAHICCTTVTFRRSCIEKTGAFDEKLTRLGAEDRDLWIRITKHYKAFYIDEPLAYYRIRNNSLSSNIEKMLKAREYVINKYCPNNSFPLFFRSRCQSAIHLEMADSYLWNHCYDQAAFHYIKSIKQFPLNLVAIWHFIKTKLKNSYLKKTTTR